MNIITLQEIIEYITEVLQYISGLEAEIKGLKQPTPPAPQHRLADHVVLDTLQIGESYYLSGDTAANKLGQAAAYRHKRDHKNFVVRREMAGPIVTGARIWRLK